MEEQKNLDQDQIAATDAAGVSADNNGAPAADEAAVEQFIEQLLGTEEPSPEGDSSQEGSDVDPEADADADDGDQGDLGDLEGSLDTPASTDGNADADDADADPVDEDTVGNCLG